VFTFPRSRPATLSITGTGCKPNLADGARPAHDFRKKKRVKRLFVILSVAEDPQIERGRLAARLMKMPPIRRGELMVGNPLWMRPLLGCQTAREMASAKWEWCCICQKLSFNAELYRLWKGCSQQVYRRGEVL
jgi:hypothetical protein